MHVAAAQAVGRLPLPRLLGEPRYMEALLHLLHSSSPQAVRAASQVLLTLPTDHLLAHIPAIAAAAERPLKATPRQRHQRHQTQPEPEPWWINHIFEALYSKLPAEVLAPLARRLLASRPKTRIHRGRGPRPMLLAPFLSVAPLRRCLTLDDVTNVVNTMMELTFEDDDEEEGGWNDDDDDDDDENEEKTKEEPDIEGFATEVLQLLLLHSPEVTAWVGCLLPSSSVSL